MQTIVKLVVITVSLVFMSCGEGKSKNTALENKENTETNQQKSAAKEPASKRVDLENKGIGSISSVSLSEVIDDAMVAKGKDIFTAKCTACHKPEEKFIGPAPKNILERRSPEWVMNMILNPSVMIQEDPLAKDLLAEFNGAPMANQNLTEDEARAVLEYFRTLK